MLGAEVTAARIEGHLSRDPMVAAQWRGEAAVAEAVASIGLEDVRLSEPDLLIRVSENPDISADHRAVEDALSVLRFLRNPGDPAGTPGQVLARIARMAARAEADDPLQDPDEDLCIVFDHCQGRAPLLEALRAAAAYAALTGRRSPVAERMVFAAAEHASRGLASGGPPRIRAADDPLRGLGGRVDATWIALPSLALTRMRFRVWSPQNPASARDLVSGLAKVLDQELGRVIAIHAWRQKAEEASLGLHGRSKLGDAIAAVDAEPVMTSRALADRISVTQRGAINLLAQMTGLGLLEEMTKRRSARIWATPGLAWLWAGGRHSPAGAAAGPGIKTGISGAHKSRLRQAEDDTGMANALEDFDAMLDRVDGLLGRSKGAAD